MSFWNMLGYAYGIIIVAVFCLYVWAAGIKRLRTEASRIISSAFVFAVFWPFVLLVAWMVLVAMPLHNYASHLRVTPSGHGYWIVLRNGASVPFGDAVDYVPMNNEVHIANFADQPADASYQYDKSGKVYVASGQMHHGDILDRQENYKDRISDMVVMNDRSGYWMLGGNGVVFNFGAAPFYGDLYKSGATFRLNSQWVRKARGIKPARLLTERVPVGTIVPVEQGSKR